MAAPIFGHRLVPSQMKVGLVILLALITMPSVQALPITPAESLLELSAIVLREFMVGILIGSVYRLLFKAAELAGSMAGYQVGLSMSSAFDPSVGDRLGAFGRFWILIGTLFACFFTPFGSR